MKRKDEFISNKMCLCSLHLRSLGAPGCDQPFICCFGVRLSAVVQHKACWCMKRVCNPPEHTTEHYSKECFASVCELSVSVLELMKGELKAAAVEASMSSPPASLSLPSSVPHSFLLFSSPALIISSRLPLEDVSCSDPPALSSKLSLYLHFYIFLPL